MKRYFIELAYDGSEYSGWQIQPKVSTVQETLEKAVRVLVTDIKGLVGCGRTDTGVHASQYYAHFDTDLPVHENFVYKVNAILPNDIAVYRCFEVNSEVHARFSATSRTYGYHLHYKKNPFRNRYSVFHVQELDIAKMNEAAKLLIGEQDFTSFSKGQTQTKTNFCNIYRAEWKSKDNGAYFEISANRFLRNMVRAVVGTMFWIGEGKMEPSDLKNVIEQMDRSAAGKSAHPQGLFLKKIEYPGI